jgi:hypothetical protein
MKSIVTKWILYSFLVGLIPVIILGASQGGIALSPIILMLSILIGLFGATIHVNIFSFTKGSNKQKIKSSLFGFVALTFVAIVFYNNSQCNLTEDQTKNRILRHIDKKENLDVKYLGEYKFNEESCQGSFNYNDPNNLFRFIVDELQNIYFDRG